MIEEKGSGLIVFKNNQARPLLECARLVTRIRYASQKVFVLRAMTHSEYDEDKWKDECGCFEPPPPPKKKKTAPTKRPTRGR